MINTLKKTKIINLIFITLLLLSFSSAAFAEANANQFKDVSSNHWASPFIDELKVSGIINGYADSTFKPDSNVRIDEFIAMTVQALGNHYESKTSDWAKPYVDKAILLGIIGDKEFPSYSAQINREQMTSIIINAITLTEYRPSNTMDLYIRNEVKDFHLITDYYVQNVLDSYKFGIITGFPDKSFQPKAFSSRAEASAVLSKLLNKDQRKPFEKTDLTYYMIPTVDMDEQGNEIHRDIAFYAPLFNGKPVNELIDVAKLLDSVKNQGKGFLDYGASPFGNEYLAHGYQTKEYYTSIQDLPSALERGFAIAERMDFAITVKTDDLASKFRPYEILVWKNVALSSNDALYSNYFFRNYEDQFKPLFKYLFENEFDSAWSMFKTGLDNNGEVNTKQFTFNGRFFSMVNSSSGINLTISLKK